MARLISTFQSQVNDAPLEQLTKNLGFARCNGSDRWLVVRLDQPHHSLSWAITEGGRTTTQNVVWLKVEGKDLAPPVKADEFLRSALRKEGLYPAVGLLTSAYLTNAVIHRAKENGVEATTIATVGMGNALRVGDPGHDFDSVGTINLCCRVSVGLDASGQLEALSMITEAKTAAVLDSGIRSKKSGQPATGTGTDYPVILSPISDRSLTYAGKHTSLGAVIGKSVYHAVTMGIDAWKLDNPNHSLLS